MKETKNIIDFKFAIVDIHTILNCHLTSDYEDLESGFYTRETSFMVMSDDILTSTTIYTQGVSQEETNIQHILNIQKLLNANDLINKEKTMNWYKIQEN